MVHCVAEEAPIHKGSEGFTYNNTIKIVKLYKKIKVKIIIENIVFVVCCLHWLGVLVTDALPSPSLRDTSPKGRGKCSALYI